MEPSVSNQIAHILLEGMEEVIGASDMQDFFHRSSYPAALLRGDSSQPAKRLSYKDLGEFQLAVETSFGLRGGRGILCRSGRASFKYLLPDFWKHLGMTNLQYRLLPVQARIKVGLRALALLLSEQYGAEITASDEGDVWKWRMQDCPFCYQRAARGPMCDFAVGMLQEYLSWTTSGRFYMVEEIECSAAGGQACVIRIQKKALE